MKNENPSVQTIRGKLQQGNGTSSSSAKYQTQESFELTEDFKEHPQGESLTELDATLPIPEIMRRAMQGIAPKMGQPIYSETDSHDEVDILRVSQSDMIDRSMVKNQLSQELAELELAASSAERQEAKEVKE